MRSTILYFILFLFLCSLFIGCKSEVEKFETEPVADYLPLQTGKYITYRLDSTVYPNFGTTTQVHYYLEKNVVDIPITDNLGRPGYRIFRYLRDTAGLKPWVSAGSYFITQQANSVEVVDNNLRIIKLASPIKEGATWKGNRYLSDDPYHSLYSFASVDNNDIGNWDFTYSDANSEIIGGRLINDVRTVYQMDVLQNVQNNKPFIATAFASRTLSVDKYAKNIGLVYSELIMWEYQPNITGPGAYTTGFGVKRTMYDHN